MIHSRVFEKTLRINIVQLLHLCRRCLKAPSSTENTQTFDRQKRAKQILIFCCSLYQTAQSLALLIDGDNASPKIISGLLAEIANYGIASVKRVYGDWTKPTLNGWKDCLLEHSLQPVQQFAYTTGKGATDGAMIIDAMDLLYTQRFSGFCLALTSFL